MKEYREGDIELGQRFYTSLIHLLTHHYNNLTKKGGGLTFKTCSGEESKRFFVGEQ